MTAISEVIGSLQGNGLWRFQGILSFFGRVNKCIQFAIFIPQYTFSLFVLAINQITQHILQYSAQYKAPAPLLFKNTTYSNVKHNINTDRWKELGY